jgi:hypothetical protein
LNRLKQIYVASIMLFFAAALYASPKQYPGTDNLFLYGHPAFVTSGASAAGGPVLSAGSYSFVLNPALTAGLQSLSADLGYTGIINTTSDVEIGSAIRLGVSVPNRFGVFSGAFQGGFLENALSLGNTLVGRIGFSRDVTDNFYLGLSVSGGYFVYDKNNDFYVAADVGAWYRVPSIAFLRQVRFGVAVQNLGKTFLKATPSKSFEARSYPAMFTPKAGVAAHLLELKDVTVGLSLDLAFPTFSNILFVAGLQGKIADLVTISAGWDCNILELYEDYGIHLPYVGIGVKFSVNTSGSNLMSKRGVDQTDIEPSAVWQRIHKDTHTASIGVTARFGVRDTLPPDIKVGDIRYE